MSSASHVLRTAGLVLLPLAAFLLGPVVDEVAPGSFSSRLLDSVLPAALPPAALAVVAAVTYRRTRRVAAALRLTAIALAVAAVGAFAYLLHVWSGASGS